MVDTGYPRDIAMFVAIFGFFASVWFGWAQERPPVAMRKWLIAGAVSSILVAVGGGLLAWRDWSTPSTLNDEDTFRAYLIIVAVEFWVCVGGAVVLALRHRRKWIPVWICAVVGIHFVPLAPIFDNLLLIVLGLALVGVASTARWADRRRAMEPSAVTGTGAGITLLATALIYAAVAVTG